MFMRRDAIPELQGLSRSEKNFVWRRAYWVAFREPKSWLGLVCFAVLYLGGRAVAGFNGGAVGAIIGALIWLQLHTQAARPWCERIRELEYGDKDSREDEND